MAFSNRVLMCHNRPARRSGPTRLLLFALGLLAGCHTQPAPTPSRPVTHETAPIVPAPPPPVVPVVRQGDEIMVAGRWFHTGARVVTWMDPGGYNAYRLLPPVKPVAKRPAKSRAAARPNQELRRA